MGIDDYLRKHTMRQHLARVAWRRRQLNEPSRADHYAMRTCQTILAAAGVASDLDEFRVRFGPAEVSAADGVGTDASPVLPEPPEGETERQRTIRLGPPVVTREHIEKMRKDAVIERMRQAGARIKRPGEAAPPPDGDSLAARKARGMMRRGR